MQQTAATFLNHFKEVDGNITAQEVRCIKSHKLFKEYSSAVKLARLILQRYDYSINKIGTHSNKCPVFWLDMPLLYEHYVLGLLREAYGQKIEYQTNGETGYPDFICRNPKMILDAKYIPGIEDGKVDTYICRQLAGYARDRKLFPDATDDVIPCAVIYPAEGCSGASNPFLGNTPESLLRESKQRIWKLHTIRVPLPSSPETLNRSTD